ncbi:unnamed protein product [Ixodes pacificus]
MYRDPKNYAYLVFLLSVLHRVKRINIMFKRNVADPLALFQELENLYLDTLKKILIPSVLRHNTSTSLLSLDLVNVKSTFLSPETADLGDVFSEKLSKLPIEDKKNVRERCFHFLKQMAVQMQLRLPNSSSALRRLNVINPEIIKSDKCRADILRLPLHFFGCSSLELESEICYLVSF